MTIHEFQKEFVRHLRDIQLILDDSGIRGPFGILLAVGNLRRNPKLQWVFPNANAANIGRPLRVQRLDEQGLIDRFNDKVRSVSVYGR